MNKRLPLVLIPQHFGSLVFDRRSSRYMPFDRECTELLQRLRAESVDDIARNNPDVLPFYIHFYELGFFGVDGHFVGEVLDLCPPADHLTGPLAVHLEVVAACNLTCRHCFAGVLPRHQDPLSLAELDRLFGTLAGLGSFRLGLTGGEPLLRRDLLDIIDLAADHGLHPCLTTNGLLITEEVAREFGKRDFAWLNVSLDGATAATNDLVRGKGTFERVVRNLATLRRHARFTLAFTIMSHNHGEVPQAAQLARRLGADTAVFRPLYPVGIARHNLELMPTFHQYSDALELLAGDLHGLDPFSPQARSQQQARVHTSQGCGAANSVCSISVQGDVNPCSFLGPQHNAGNIRHQPFEQIWNNSQIFKSLRQVRNEKFKGGCRARAQTFGGSIHACDPWLSEWKKRTSFPHPLDNVEAHP